MFTIGDTADRTGLAVKTIRYYADIGLVVPSGRTESGYRLYGDREIRKLLFVQRARGFGFSIDTCRELLALYDRTDRPSAEVKRIALDHLGQIRTRLAELQELHDELRDLAAACHGDRRPDCPILKSLAAPAGQSVSGKTS